MMSTPTEPIGQQNSPEKIALALTEHVQQVGTVYGARLGLLARTLYPGFSPAQYGFRKFRDFIAKYAPNLEITGSKGPDLIYRCRSAPLFSADEVQVQTELERDRAPDLWRIWVSPGTNLVLWVDRKSGRVDAADRHLPVPAEYAVLRPASVEVHVELARSFLGEVRDPLLRMTLTNSLSTDSWWRSWQRSLRGYDPALLAKWYDHRQGRLSEALKHSLSLAGLEDNVAKVAFGGILTSRRKRPTRVASSEPGGARPIGAAAPIDLLRIIEFIVSRMSEAELRSLSVPLGLALDAVEYLKGTR